MIEFRNLPVYRHRDEILKGLESNQTIIVESPTGSGKTTQIPLILKEAGYDKNGIIGITQPRRIAAMSVCSFIRKQINDEGAYCAYKMRFIDTSDKTTRIKIMTDGILLQEVKLDKLLSKYSVIMVDEAHALGCIGKSGAGSFEYAGIDPKRVDIWMGTLSKTLCTCGGFIAGEKALIELLKYKASGFVYSVGLSPVLAAASLKALDLMHTESWRTQRLQENGKFALECARRLGLNTGLAEGTEILPVVVGSSMTAAFLSNLLLDAGVCVLPIIYPVVSEGAARLRFFLSASHSKEQIAQALELTAKLLPQARAREAQFVTKVQSDDCAAEERADD